MTDKYKEVLGEAVERFERVLSDDQDNRKNQKADTLFVYSPGEQWPDDVRSTRKAWNELCLEFNQLKQFVKQVVNDQRQNRPGVQIHPADGQASKDTAKILQGLIRNIEYESKAETVYDAAFETAVVGGRGWWRIISKYNGDGFNQDLALMPIQDASTVYADLNYQQPDGSDREYVFIVQNFTRKEFERKWPDADAVSFDAVEDGWGSTDDIIVADYYRRVCKMKTVCLLEDGTVCDKVEGLKGIVREREVEEYSVEWYTIAGGNQVLEKHDWAGSIIPVVCMVGEDMIIDGKRIYQGLTRHARDAQSMLNFGMTQQAIQLSLTPRAPWVMAEGQNVGYEGMWRDANTKNFGALVYKPTTIEGVLAPPPQRTHPAMISEGWDRWVQTMIGMIKSTIGMYEQSLGQKGNETSGRAITAREKQGDTATFNYVDNLSRAIALTGRILLEAIPKYYDTQRILHIINPDDTRSIVTVNQPTLDPSNPLQAIKLNDITVGRYSVVCEAGPSYATKRQETSEALMQLVQAFPPAAQVAGDLIVKSLDVADADIIAERLKLILPPEVKAAEAAKKQENGNGTPPDPAMLAQLQEQQQHLDQAAQTMHAMQEQIVTLSSEANQKTLDRQTQVSLTLQKEDHEREMAEREAETARQLELIKQQAETERLRYKTEKDAELKIILAQMADQSKDNEQARKLEADLAPQVIENGRHEELVGAVGQLVQVLAAPKVRKIIKGIDGRPEGVIESIGE